MKSPVVKRSIVIAGHKTSVSLEDAFWKGLKEIASGRDATLSELVASIDADHPATLEVGQRHRFRFEAPNRAAGIRTSPATIEVNARTNGSMRPTGTAQAPRPTRNRSARLMSDSVMSTYLPTLFTSGLPPTRTT